MDGFSSSRRRRPHRDGHAFQPELIQESTLLLLDRAKGGNDEALEEVCRRYLPRLFRWATGRLPARARGIVDTGDLVQETLVRTIQRLDSFEPQHSGAFPAYLRTAILNRIRDEVRSAARKPEAVPLAGTEEDPSPSPLEEAIGHEFVERYERALTRLTEEERAAIFLRMEMNMSFEEIADALHKPSTNAAWMAVSRALMRLAREMSDEKRQ